MRHIVLEVHDDLLGTGPPPYWAEDGVRLTNEFRVRFEKRSAVRLRTIVAIAKKERRNGGRDGASVSRDGVTESIR